MQKGLMSAFAVGLSLVLVSTVEARGGSSGSRSYSGGRSSYIKVSSGSGSYSGKYGKYSGSSSTGYKKSITTSKSFLSTYGTKFTSGYFFKGKSTKPFKYRLWNSKYHRYHYWCPYAHGYYWWCEADDCYYPQDYSPPEAKQTFTYEEDEEEDA